MKVLVIGAGVIGTTTAYYLARHGAEVTLLDRRPGVALETSFANAGQVSPGYSTPWAAPGIPLKALKWLFQRDAPLALRADGSLFQLRWMLAMLRNCTAARYAVNKERMMRVAEYSRDCLGALRGELDLQYEQRTGGTLQLFRSASQFDAAQRDIEVLRQCGVAFELVERAALSRIEPALAHSKAELFGGLRLPGDETGDCHLFTQALASRLPALGVETRFGATVAAFDLERGRIAGIRLAGGERLQADRYVLALGSYSREVLLPLGLDLPVYPLKGYSLTVPLTDASRAPVSTVLDETYKVAVTRFDRRIRVGGMAEVAGFDLRLDPRRRRTLEKVLDDLFPGADLPKAEFWTGLRPATPDGTPLIGATPYKDLFLNTGHGTLGWTMACGASRLLADLITGQRPQISTEGLAIDRYGSRVTPAGRRSSPPPPSARLRTGTGSPARRSAS